MNIHWQPPRSGRTETSSITGGLPDGRFELALLRHGARTAIGRQFVSYPFHLTRPFALDRAIPSLLTIYQQSSSGGLYRGERLACRYDVGPHAAAHVTTQAATIVHDCHGQQASLAADIALDEGAFFALTPDPLVLFPGASCTSRIDAHLAPGSVLLLADAFALHDPEGLSRPFAHLASDVAVRDAAGRLLVRDCFHITGDALLGSASPIGDWHVVSSYLLLGASDRLPTADNLSVLLSETRAAVGISALSQGAGWSVRCLSADAVAARRVGDLLFSICVNSAFGSVPTPRRK